MSDDREMRQRFMAAARYGLPDTLDALIKDGADVNTVESDGLSALHYAALRNCVQSVSMLIKAGADINICTPERRSTPLHYAAEYGCADAARLLLEAGCDMNARDRDGRTAREQIGEGNVYLMKNDKRAEMNHLFRQAQETRAAALLKNNLERLERLSKPGSRWNSRNR